MTRVARLATWFVLAANAHHAAVALSRRACCQPEIKRCRELA